jgi:hypothetical protein
VNVAEETRRILILEAVADEARREAAEGRARLADRARRQLAEEHVAPSWNLPEIAKVTLGVSSPKIEIDDTTKLLAWVEARNPDGVIRVPTIRPEYLAQLLGEVIVDHGIVLWTQTGEVVPGLKLRPGGQPKALSIVPHTGVRAGLAAVAAEILGSAQAAIMPPAEAATVVDAEIGPGDPFAMFPPILSRGGGVH